MNPPKVVIHEVECHHRDAVLQLFREGVCQPRKAAHRHPHREVLAFDVGYRDVLRVGIFADDIRSRIRGTCSFRGCSAFFSSLNPAVNLGQGRNVHIEAECALERPTDTACGRPPLATRERIRLATSLLFDHAAGRHRAIVGGPLTHCPTVGFRIPQRSVCIASRRNQRHPSRSVRRARKPGRLETPPESRRSEYPRVFPPARSRSHDEPPALCAVTDRHRVSSYTRGERQGGESETAFPAAASATGERICSGGVIHL